MAKVLIKKWNSYIVLPVLVLVVALTTLLWALLGLYSFSWLAPKAKLTVATGIALYASH